MSPTSQYCCNSGKHLEAAAAVGPIAATATVAILLPLPAEPPRSTATATTAVLLELVAPVCWRALFFYYADF